MLLREDDGARCGHRGSGKQVKLCIDDMDRGGEASSRPSKVPSNTFGSLQDGHRIRRTTLEDRLQEVQVQHHTTSSRAIAMLALRSARFARALVATGPPILQTSQSGFGSGCGRGRCCGHAPRGQPGIKR